MSNARDHNSWKDIYLHSLSDLEAKMILPLTFTFLNLVWFETAKLLAEEPPMVSFIGRNHLSVLCAGFHFRSVNLITSVRFPLRYLRQIDSSLSIEMTLA